MRRPLRPRIALSRGSALAVSGSLVDDDTEGSSEGSDDQTPEGQTPADPTPADPTPAPKPDSATAGSEESE